ncbi:MAG: hypothetical protein ACTH2Q_18560 [Propionibacteriaceae bacterium]
MFGPPPIRARAVLVFVLLAILVLPTASVIMDRAGWGMRAEGRIGTAQVHRCAPGLVSYRCTADVTFEDGQAFDRVRVRSTESVSGAVQVAEHDVWNPERRRSHYDAEVWVRDHRPTPHPNLWPVGWILGGAVIVLLAVVVIKPLGNWFVRRSQRQWREARIIAGRSVG